MTTSLLGGRLGVPVGLVVSPVDVSLHVYSCGGTGHTGQDCSFRCGKKGHLAKVCRSTRVSGKPQQGSRGARKATRCVDTEPPDSEPTDDILCHVDTPGPDKVNPYKAVLELDGNPVSMEVDTGAAVSIISERTQKSLFPSTDLAKPNVRLRTYTSKPIPVVGQMSVEVKHNGYVGRHTLYVVERNGPALVGRDWLSKIRHDWVSIKAIVSSKNKHDADELLKKYAEVFQPGLGNMKKIKAQLCLKPDARPRFCRPCSVPFAIKQTVGKELDRLEETGVLR